MTYPDLALLLRFWQAQDEAFDRVEPTWWGAVVSDPRYPALQEPNYARVEARDPVRLAEIEDRLLPAMARSGSRRAHVVVFYPEDQAELLVEASTRGERIVWDLVMEHPGRGPGGDAAVSELARLDDGFWSVHRASLRWFDITDEAVLDQLQAMERELLLPRGRRWFAVQDGDRTRALAALLVLEDIGYLDHVVTFPESRRRGFASALVDATVRAARSAGARRTYLLTEPDGAATAMYEGIGFRRVTQIASWISEIAPRRG